MTIRGNIALQKMCPGTLPFECRLLRNFSFIWKLGVYNNYTGYIQSQDKLDLSLPIDLLSHQYIELSQLCLAIYVLPIASIFFSFSYLVVLVEGRLLCKLENWSTSAWIQNKKSVCRLTRDWKNASPKILLKF